MRAAGVACACALAAVVLAATGCRETVWPSDAETQEFCEAVTSPSFADGRLDEVRRVGTPPDLPWQARRHLIDLAAGEPADAEGDADVGPDAGPAAGPDAGREGGAALASYVEEHCGA